MIVYGMKYCPIVHCALRYCTVIHTTVVLHCTPLHYTPGSGVPDVEKSVSTPVGAVKLSAVDVTLPTVTIGGGKMHVKTKSGTLPFQGSVVLHTPHTQPALSHQNKGEKWAGEGREGD
jgi:hypothetical protein